MDSHRFRLGLLAIVLGATAGCRARTEIVIGVLTDLRAPDVLDFAQLDVAVQGVPVLQVPWDISGVPGMPYILPGSYGIYSESGEAQQVELTLTGSKGRTPVVKRRALVSLVSEKTLFMRMALVAGCRTVSDCASTETCVEGVCRPAAVDARRLPLYVKDMERTVQCNSGTIFIDTGTREAVPMSGPGCGPGETCEEGTCYRPLDTDGGMTQGLWVAEATPMAAVGRTIRGASVSLSIGPGAAPELWAVGDNGTVIHRLDDAGPMAAASWVTETVPSTAQLNAIDATSSADVWIAGDEVVLHRSGSTWTAIPAPGHMLTAVAQGTSGPLFAGHTKTTPAQGVILRWTGSTLAMEQVPAGPELMGLAAVGTDTFVAVGLGGRILRSSGRTWTDVSSLAGGMSVGALYGATSLGGGEALLVGDRGVVLRLGPTSATRIEAPTTNRLLAALASPRVIVGEGGTILTTDASGNLVVEPTPARADILGIAVAAVGTTQQRLLAVGRAGSLWTSLRPLQ
jgi:photosystem II stability/assembly factor-like uncharacterized protein